MAYRKRAVSTQLQDQLTLGAPIAESALREAVVNAIAHRDHRSTANVQVYIFQDRVEIVTPGGLPAGMREEDLGSKSVPRNPCFLVCSIA